MENGQTWSNCSISLKFTSSRQCVAILGTPHRKNQKHIFQPDQPSHRYRLLNVVLSRANCRPIARLRFHQNTSQICHFGSSRSDLFARRTVWVTIMYYRDFRKNKMQLLFFFLFFLFKFHLLESIGAFTRVVLTQHFTIKFTIKLRQASTRDFITTESYTYSYNQRERVSLAGNNRKCSASYNKQEWRVLFRTAHWRMTRKQRWWRGDAKVPANW